MKVALIADVHSNIFALEAVYADLEREGVDKIFVIGDLIGYYYWPKQVVQLLRADPRVFCIRGNHESILGEVRSDPSKADYYRGKYGTGYDVCLSELDQAETDWLLSLPCSADIDIAGASFHLSHGALGSVDKYIYPDASLETLTENLSGSTFTVFGHTHYAFAHTSDNQILINPGSVGQPRDVGGLASYAIVNLENRTVRFKRKQFDVSRLTSVAKQRDPQLAYLWKIMSR